MKWISIGFIIIFFLDGLQIFKGELQIPKWLSPEVQNLIRRILDPNPVTRITLAGIKEDEWFRKDYVPANAEDEEEEEDVYIDDEAFSTPEVVYTFELHNCRQLFSSSFRL